jgi:cell division protein FtsL
MNVMDTFYRIPFSTLLAYIPVLATVVTCYFSVILARATLRYVAATDKGLALAREEFEREWSPELHLKLERISTTEARIVVTNLAKLSVLLQLLQIRKLTFLVPFERCVLNDPLLGGMSYTQDIGKRLVSCTGADFEGQIAATMTFFASGRMFRTDWFRFHITVERGRILRLEPSNIPARRVRVLTNREGAERRREFVQDVAAGSAPVKTPDSAPV